MSEEPILSHVRMISPNGEVSNISGSEAGHLWNGALSRPGRVIMRQEGETRIIEDQHGQTLLTPVWEPSRHEVGG